MIIALISETKLNDNTGTSVYVDEMSKNLAKYCKVYLFVPTKDNSYAYKDKSGRYVYHIKNSPENLYQKFLTERGLFLRNLEIELDKIINKRKINLFHCLYGHYFHFLKKYNKPIFWTCHNVPPNENRPFLYNINFFTLMINNFFFTLIRLKHKFLIKKLKFTKVFTPSIYVKNILINEIEVPARKVTHINNGINYPVYLKSLFHKKYDIFTIITVASFKSHKNLHLIPKIIKNLNINKFRWIIIGKITDKKYYDNIINDFNEYVLNKKLIIKNDISEKQKNLLLKKSHLYVQLSSNEGFGIPLLEAKFSNLNSLSTICGASKEITNEFGGHLIKNIDEKKIANQINNISNSRKLYNNNNNINKVSWSWKYLSNKLYSNYKKC